MPTDHPSNVRARLNSGLLNEDGEFKHREEYGGNTSDTDGGQSTPVNGSATCCDYCRCIDAKASDIEKYSRIVFPTVFACFNILYWITYLNISVVTDEEGFIPAEEG